MYPEQLTYDELLNPNGICMKILSPRYIPIYPKVYESTFAYTPDFAKKILNSIDESVSLDIDNINKTLGTKIIYEKPDMKSLIIETYPDIRSIDVQYGNSGIAAEPGSFTEILLTKYDTWPQMNIQRAKIFSMTNDKLKIPSWFIHNIDDHGIGIYLFYRSFAILSNNLGIEQIKSCSG
jgi:hypothetical protein